MVRKFSPPVRATQSRTSICLPVGMKESLEQTMLATGWSLKRRSSWIATACADLLDNPDHEDLIREEFFDGKTVILPLTLDSVLMRNLDAVASNMTSPSRIVDRSSVIRTAITQAVLAAAGRRLRSPSLAGVPLGDTQRDSP